MWIKHGNQLLNLSMCEDLLVQSVIKGERYAIVANAASCQHVLFGGTEAECREYTAALSRALMLGVAVFDYAEQQAFRNDVVSSGGMLTGHAVHIHGAEVTMRPGGEADHVGKE